MAQLRMSFIRAGGSSSGSEADEGDELFVGAAATHSAQVANLPLGSWILTPVIARRPIPGV